MPMYDGVDVGIGEVEERKWRCFDDLRACPYNADTNVAVKGRSNKSATTDLSSTMIERDQAL